MTNPIVMLAGLPGTGKSTIAKKLEDRLGFDLHSVIGIRRDFGHRRYRATDNGKVIPELHRRTNVSVSEGRGVIVDNTNVTQGVRQLFYELGKHYEVDILVLECYCSEDVAKRRMRLRPASDGLVVEPRNTRPYDRLAKKWQDISPDLEKFAGYPLSYVRYNTVNNTVEEVRVNERITPLVKIVKSVLGITSV